MGSFPGHAIPGTFFALFAVWWTTQLPRRRLLCQQKKITFFNTATFPVALGKLPKYPVEGVAKMLAAVLGMSAELFASLGYGEMELVSIGDLQHFTMYSFFLMSGLVDCFVYRGSRTFPHGMDYLALTLAFCAEWILFYHHLTGRSPLDVQLHTFLIYVITACVTVTILELKYQESELACLVRGYVTFLQGTWFYQIGFILYPPLRSLTHWDGNNPEHMTMVTMIFAWHCIADAVIVMVIYSAARCCYTRHCRLFDFRVEHQLVAQGWTLMSLRLKRKRHKGNLYMQVGNDEQNNSLSEDEIVETEMN